MALLRLPGDPEAHALSAEARWRHGRAFVRLPTGVTHYQLAGPPRAPTVVFVHGLSVPLHLWDTLFDPLAEAGHRVLRYDLFGRGLSDRPPVRYDEELYDRQLSSLLDALGVGGPVHLVVLSMAVSIAATFAHRRPARVRTLTAIGPGFGAGRRAPRRLRTPGLGELIMATRVAPGLAEGQLADLHHPERFPDWPARYREQMRYPGFRRALLSTLRHYMGRDVEGDYRRLHAHGAPTLAVWGAHDQRVTPEERARIRALLPRARTVELPDAAHLPHLEQPAVVLDLLRDLLLAEAPRG